MRTTIRRATVTISHKLNTCWTHWTDITQVKCTDMVVISMGLTNITIFRRTCTTRTKTIFRVSSRTIDCPFHNYSRFRCVPNFPYFAISNIFSYRLTRSYSSSIVPTVSSKELIKNSIHITFINKCGITILW